MASNIIIFYIVSIILSIAVVIFNIWVLLSIRKFVSAMLKIHIIWHDKLTSAGICYKKDNTNETDMNNPEALDRLTKMLNRK